MCLIFIALKNHPKYKLIVAANRDEFYDRKTAPASYWEDHPQILGGRDLQASGTWLGMTKSGRIGMVTNFRDPKNIHPKAPSRGKLVTDFLLDTSSGEKYLEKIEGHAKKYNGFSLIAGTVDDLYYLTNYREGVIILNSGLFGLSNHLLETPWPKVENGKNRIQLLLKAASVKDEDLFDILQDEAVSPDEKLPDTGLELPLERAMSAAFIRTSGYGTRCSTVIMVDYSNEVNFMERVFDPVTFQYSQQTFQYKIA
jgi:uncharacterized protein with NRDE domain